MFGRLLHSRRKSSPAKPSFFRPTLESLERRDCPSNISLITTVQNDNMVAISGMVSDTPNPGGLTVELYGTASGSATTDANGNYSVVLQGTGSGNEIAQTSDGQSNQAMVYVSMTTITAFDWMSYPADMFVFTGSVTGPNVAGETVTFGGIHSLQGKTTTVNSDGSFSIAVQLDGKMDDNGNATAQIMSDANGLSSNMDWTYVMQTQMSGTGGA